jgi:hypothetical protein
MVGVYGKPDTSALAKPVVLACASGRTKTDMKKIRLFVNNGSGRTTPPYRGCPFRCPLSGVRLFTSSSSIVFILYFVGPARPSSLLLHIFDVSARSSPGRPSHTGKPPSRHSAWAFIGEWAGFRSATP